MALDPNHEAKAGFLAHWEDVLITRSNPTFADVAPNHDHVVRIYQPAKASSKPKASSSRKPKASKLAIPVIYHV